MTSNAFNDGRSFEKSLEMIHGIYERQGRATVSKVEPPVRVLGWGPARKVIFLENPFCDFTGVLTELGNRPCHFEAKSTSEPILPCQERSKFSRTQREALARWRAAGAATWLLWEMGGKVRIFFHNMILTGLAARRSLVWDDGLDVPAGLGYVYYDWLTSVKRYEQYL